MAILSNINKALTINTTATTISSRSISPATQMYDSYQNTITGYGTSQDKALNYSIYLPDMLSQQLELSSLYRGHEIAWKIIDFPVDDAMSEGITISNENKDDIQNCLKDKSLWWSLRQAWIWARVFTGGAVLLFIDDGREQNEPVDINNIKDIKVLTVIEREFIHPESYGVSGQSELYFVGQGRSENNLWHIDRMLLMKGIPVGFDTMVETAGFGISELQRPKESLEDYSTSQNIRRTITQDMIYGIFKIFGLNNELNKQKTDDAGNVIQTGMQAVKSGLTAMANGLSSVRGIVLDSQSDYKKESVNLSGVKELTNDCPKQRISAAVIIPHTMLFGENSGASGAGLNTSDNETTDYERAVSRLQNKDLSPQLDKLFLYVAAFLNMPEGERVAYTFNPIRPMSPNERADYRKTIAETDQIYINNKVVTNNEVREARFSGDQYNPELQVEGDYPETETTTTTPDNTAVPEEIENPENQEEEDAEIEETQ